MTHSQYRTTTIAIILIFSATLWAGGAVGGKSPMPHRLSRALPIITRAAQRCVPYILHDEPIGDVPAGRANPPQERGEAGRESASWSGTTPPVPAPATGFTDDLSAAAHSYLAENAINLQWSFDRASLIARITAYMGNVPAAYLVPLMVDLGHDYGIDARLCAVTIIEESSGCGNLFGSLYGHPDGYEEQVRWYYDQVIYNCNQTGIHPSDVWHIAWYWHGGGSEGADHSFYADNVTRQVEGI